MTPKANVPQSEKEWIRLLREILAEILRAVGGAAIHLFDVLWPHVSKAWEAVRNFVVENPWYTVALVLGVLLAHPLAKGLAAILGFTASGIQAGSIAAQVQAQFYGGFVPAGSTFAILQSCGAL